MDETQLERLYRLNEEACRLLPEHEVCLCVFFGSECEGGVEIEVLMHEARTRGTCLRVFVL